MKNQSHPGFYILGIIALVCLIFLSSPHQAYADTANYVIYGHDRADKAKLRTYMTQDNQTAYCFDANRDTLNNSGNKFYSKPQAVSNEVSYLMLHSYPVTTYINGKNHSPQMAQLITQVAVWMYNGFITEKGIITKKTGTQFSTVIGRVPAFIEPYGNTVVDAARSLVRDAKKNGPKSNIPNELKAKLYVPGNNTYQRMLVGPKNPWGRIKLTKVLDIPAQLGKNPYYDITKIEFALYKDGKPTGKVFKIKPDLKNGKNFVGYDKQNPRRTYIDVTPGFYSIKEANVPSGIVGASPTKNVYVSAYTGEKSIANFKLENTLKYVEVDTLIYKKQTLKEGDIPLQGAQFEVRFTSGKESRKWIFKSDKNGKVRLDKLHLVSGDPLFELGKTRNRLPLGTLTIKEIKAPAGYTLSSQTHTYDLANLSASKKAFKTVVIENKPVRANIKFQKIDGATQSHLSYVAFRLTNLKSGEFHIIFTDAKGTYDSSLIQHSNQTNANDSISEDAIRNGKVDFTKTQCGLWFRGLDKDSVDDTLGSLPYGSYMLEELRGLTNKGYELVTMRFEVKSNESIDLGTIVNWKVGIQSKLTAEKQSESSYLLKDTISYVNLPAGKEYSVKTSFVVLSEDGTTEPLMVEGKPYSKTTLFTPEKREGSVTIECAIPKEILVGKTIVCYEEIYQGEELIVSHTNPQDAEQTVEFEREKIIRKTGIGDNTTIAMAVLTSLSGLLLYMYLKRHGNVF